MSKPVIISTTVIYSLFLVFLLHSNPSIVIGLVQTKPQLQVGSTIFKLNQLQMFDAEHSTSTLVREHYVLNKRV